MTEFGYVEAPVLEWLSGFPKDAAGGLGWTYRSETAMAAFERPLDDPLVERLLLPAIVRINDCVENEEQARIAVEALRRTLVTPDKLAANRETLNALRDGVTVPLRAGEDSQTVKFIAFERNRQDLNDFTATNQYRVQGVRQCRDDTVLLVNGIPLVIAEYKSILSSGKDWTEGVRQLHRYQREAPLMLASNVFCVAADEFDFRYGTILFHDAEKKDINQHLDRWGPWLSQYPDARGYWNEQGADDAGDALQIAVSGLLRLTPCHVLDFLEHFVTFETSPRGTVKKIARYQQFEAVNDILDRTVDLIGQEVEPHERTGLVWHTQGSGKSLTMIFAAYKLRRHAKLENPTVLIVVDRRDLKTQISDDFDANDYPNVVKALSVKDLKQKLATGWRGTLVTTIQSFQQMEDLSPLDRDNIVCLVDECHRSQKGKGKGKNSPALTMRAKLPKAFRYGLTGTPIDRTMTNTHRDFGPRKDGEQERYLSYYGIKRAIKDGTTLEVHYQRDVVPFAVDEEALSAGFEQICEEMELEDEEIKDFVQKKRARWKELAADPDRIDIVIDKVVEHFLTHPDPNGFKAQLVCVDREACVDYKQALDAKLKARGLPAEWSDVIYSPAQNDEPKLKQYHYDKKTSDSLIDYFKLTPSAWEEWNSERFGEDRSKWRPPLKILIVCDRLLTGFDAPVEQVMYLDKPLRDHNLLQAIARTNRPLPAMQKRTGVVVDFFGVFKDLEKALNFDESVREEALIDWEALKKAVPNEVDRCMELFDGIKIEDARVCLLAALKRLRDPEAALNFEHNFKSLETLWEAVSPDPCLYDLRYTYAWLCSIYVAHRRQQAGPRVTYEELAAKTRDLIREHTTFLRTAEELPVYKIDGDYLARIDDLPTATDKAAMLEAALTRELREGEGGFIYRQLGERLHDIKARKDTSDEETARRLRELEQLAVGLEKARSEPQRLGLTGTGEFELFTVLRAFAADTEEELLVDASLAMISYLNENSLLPPGWSASATSRKRVEQSLIVESCEERYEPLNLDDGADPEWLKAAMSELAELDK